MLRQHAVQIRPLRETVLREMQRQVIQPLPKQHLPRSEWEVVQSVPSVRGAARSGDQGKAAAPAYRPLGRARLLYG